MPDSSRRINLAIMSAALLVGLVALEAIISQTGLAPKQLTFWKTNIRSSELRHCNSVFCVTYVTNGQGLRARKIYGPKPAETIRIVVVGDSYTFGWGVENAQTIPTHLSDILKSRYPRKSFEVVNLGVPGTNPDSFVHSAAQYGRALEADLVVVNIFEIRNTFLNLGSSDLDVLRAQQLANWLKVAKIPDFDPEAHLRRSFLWHSALFRWTIRTWRELRRGEDARTFNVRWGGPAATQAAQPLIQRDDRTTCLAKPQRKALCENDFRAVLESPTRGRSERAALLSLYRETGVLRDACDCRINLDTVKDSLERVLLPYDTTLLTDDKRGERIAEVRIVAETAGALSRDASEYGAKLITMLFPNHLRFIELSPKSGARDSFVLWNKALRDSKVLTEIFLDTCHVNKATCIDGVTPMKRFAAGKPARELYYPRDFHFTGATNRAFARIIADALTPSLGAMITGNQ